MKTQHHFIITLSVLFLLSYGCRKIELGEDIKALDVTVRVAYDTSKGNFSLPIEGINIKLENLWNGKINQIKTNQNGLAEFDNISAGVYNIMATLTIPKEDFLNYTGQFSEDDVTLNASINSVTLNNQTNAILDLQMKLGRIGGLVLKQIYYAGSDTKNGATFRDQFIEIYNNSNELIYADSLYIAQVWGTNSANPDLSKGFYLTSGPMVGQLDWSKSIGMPSGINASEDYFYPKSLYRIPGNGTDYPIQPGESIILAQTAVNHKAPYSNSTGGSINIKDPSLTVDLSNADFEVYLAPYLASPLASDIDNPAVPNMIMLAYSGKDWLLDNPGRDGYIIFKTDKDIPSTFPQYPDPTQLAITQNTTMYYQIPLEFAIDAVEIQPNSPTSRVPKRLYSEYDAGFTFCPAGSYSSQSVIRKTSKIVSGRRILMDTNNSTNDFDYLEKAEPKAFK